MSAQQCVAARERAGFVFVSQKGSHGKYRHPDTGRRCVVPMHRQLAIGTLASILRQAGMTPKELLTCSAAADGTPNHAAVGADPRLIEAFGAAVFLSPWRPSTAAPFALALLDPGSCMGRSG